MYYSALEILRGYYSPAWTAKSYLLRSAGSFATVFKARASHSILLLIIDYISILGLILIGIGLFIGLLARPFKLATTSVML
jgi:thiosulfate dehydrogenase [quinone] large subunit